MTYKPEIGTIIRATLRPQDLIPAFLDELRRIDPTGYAQMVTCSASYPIPAYVYDEGDESEWWYSEDAQWLLETLFDDLDAQAPEGCYFGAHPGDSSDFGYWPIED